MISIAALCVAPASVWAQQNKPATEPREPSLIRRDDPDPMSTIEEEMRAKRAIRYAEKEYQENIERAHELSDLGSQLSASFKQNEHLTRDDLKKLDRIEKLTKSIRNAAGGSDDDKQSDKHPADLAASVKEMFEVVGSLARRVEKTPRHVISAAVIDEANALLELVRTVRELSRI